MRVDPEVCRRKFDGEVRRLEHHALDLRSWGCRIETTVFPNVDVLYLPRHALEIRTPTPRQSPLGIHLPQVEFARLAGLPPLGGLPFGVRFGLDDFDQRPISVSFRDPITWEPLPADRVPVGQYVGEEGKKADVVVQQHPLTRLPFLCMQGIREYHEHPQHGGDEWALLRREMGLVYAVHCVWRSCIEDAIPSVVLTAQTPRPTQVSHQIGIRWGL